MSAALYMNIKSVVTRNGGLAKVSMVYTCSLHIYCVSACIGQQRGAGGVGVQSSL